MSYNLYNIVKHVVCRTLLKTYQAEHQLPMCPDQSVLTCMALNCTRKQTLLGTHGFLFASRLGLCTPDKLYLVLPSVEIDVCSLSKT